MPLGSTLYNTIVCSENPRGIFRDCIVSGTPKPGVVMQIKNATEPVNNLWTYEVFNQSSDGQRPKGPIAVLLEDSLQGKTITDAYVTATIGHLYFPLPGDLLLMQLQDVAGTADTHAIGEKLIIDNSTGTLIATTGTPQTEAFVVMETMTALSADTLTLVMFSCY